MNKKNGQPPKETDRNTQANSTPALRRLSPRMARLVAALLDNPTGVPREATDRIAPASNSPHYIGLLRARLGLQIPCERVDFVTKDGEPSWYGLYSLSGEDREKLAKLGVGG